jgi:hypothetical protein
MKHHVFLFVLIFSCFVCAMDRNIVNNITNIQIADALKVYCSVYPHLVNTKNAKDCIKQIRVAPLTFNDKIAILEEMKNFPQPNDVCIIGNKAVLFERSNYETKSEFY